MLRNFSEEGENMTKERENLLNAVIRNLFLLENEELTYISGAIDGMAVVKFKKEEQQNAKECTM